MLYSRFNWEKVQERIGSKIDMSNLYSEGCLPSIHEETSHRILSSQTGSTEPQTNQKKLFSLTWQQSCLRIVFENSKGYMYMFSNRSGISIHMPKQIKQNKVWQIVSCQPVEMQRSLMKSCAYLAWYISIVIDINHYPDVSFLNNFEYYARTRQTRKFIIEQQPIQI